MKKFCLLISSLFSILIAYTQKRVINYPLEYTKGMLEKKEYDSYFLQDNTDSSFILIMKDNKKIDYVLYDNKFKIKSKMIPEDGLKNTIFNADDVDYLGGVAKKGVFQLVYKVTDKKFLGSSVYYQKETIDFAAKTIKQEPLFEISKTETLLISFGDFGQYFSITTNKTNNELKFYGLDADGKSYTKSVNINIPPTSKAKNTKDYFEKIKLISASEEPGLDLAKEKVKLFHSAEKIRIIVNESDDPTQIYSINKKDFSLTTETIDHTSLTKNEKGSSYINSFLFKDMTASLILNKKNIRIALYDKTGVLLKVHELNDNTDVTTLAQSPVMTTRNGKKASENDISDLKKVIKSLDKGSEGIIVTVDKKGRLIITVGTHDPIQTGGGGGGGSFSTQHTNMSLGSASTRVGPNSYETTYYRPGSSSYTKYGANYYRSLQFKIMIDPVTLNLVKGLAPLSISDQIKDYLSEVDPKAQAKNQFQLNGKEYYGYYMPADKSYVVEEIYTRK
jgi:hypothetical protein